MGRIKKVRFPQRNPSTKLRTRKLRRNDQFDRSFWEEFFRLESLGGEGMEDLSDGERLVTITIKDEETGEEWVIERVKLLREKEKSFRS